MTGRTTGRRGTRNVALRRCGAVATIAANNKNQGEEMGLRLNLGCGRSPRAGWVNLDIAPLPGVDVVADLDRCRTQPLPFPDDSASEFHLAHVLEHIGDTLGLMQELHRIAVPGARCTIRCPYGSSDDAYEDPTHRHRFFMNSFQFFGQPSYWRADYGYRGDWEPAMVTLLVRGNENGALSNDEIWDRIRHQRNVVSEVVAELDAVKPIRAAARELLAPTKVAVQFV
jgi:hypothetical protein